MSKKDQKSLVEYVFPAKAFYRFDIAIMTSLGYRCKSLPVIEIHRPVTNQPSDLGDQFGTSNRYGLSPNDRL
jgi:hypothetical protein